MVFRVREDHVLAASRQCINENNAFFSTPLVEGGQRKQRDALLPVDH